VVLLPVRAITRLDEDQLRAVLAHELAHIRRHDFLVNVGQRCMEAVLFYHPAVWWLSARVRVERENCCDDLALQVCGDRLLYAQALVELERSRGPRPAFSIAATGANLTERIHRIFGRQAIRYDWQSVAAIAVTLTAWCLLGSSQSSTVHAVAIVSPPPVAAPTAEALQTQATPPLKTALSAITAIVTAQQTTATQSMGGGASIEGVVLKAGTSVGLPGANVELTQLFAGTGNVSPPKLIVSGPDGRFAFRDLTDGGYRLVADLPLTEYQPSEYGQKTPRSRGTTIRLSSSQKMQNVRIEMVATGAIAGRVTGSRGEPVARARVVAMEMTYRDGQPVLNILQAVQTDDLGQYRLFWLSPGKYYVGARTTDITRKTTMVEMTAPGRVGTFEEVSSPVIRRRSSNEGEFEETDRMVYFGNTVDPGQAIGIDVPSGTAREGINVSLATGVARALRVRGTVVNGAGPSTQSASVRLIPRNWTADAIIPNATSDPQGSFDLPGVIPGSYVLYASVPSPGGALSGRIPVDVGNTNVDNLKVTVTAGVDITGHMTITGDAAPVSTSTLRVTLTRAPDILGLPQAPAATGGRGPAGSNGVIGADGSFRLAGVGTGDYRLNIVGLPKGTYIQTAQLEQENVLTTGIRVDGSAVGPVLIRLGSDPGRVEGAAVDERLQPVSNAVVVLVPDTALRRQKHLFKAAATDLLGHFTIEDVPPGSYKLFAWDHVPEGAWENDTFMKTVESRGRTINVSAKATATFDGLAISR
jgi:hypothetical protein